ncbi:uncharacterized protein RAG0_12616 [Rhynchosporium agropyri]|uniref:DUF3295 domain-containing protein n=1 Tax=Rhynchosporium agropyri TaxID=914238 RepID=A0A1E1L955_9HELO|nr:uncharacterized protein RAG0_12616 [Rhynchosporium agropyri]
MIITIKEKKDLKPLSPRNQSHLATLDKGRTQPSSLTQTPTPADNCKPITSDNSSDHSAWPVPSDSAHSNTSRTIVVRGFFSSIPTGDIAAANSENGQMLAVGGASGDDSTSEQTDFIWNSLQHSAPQLKKRETRLTFGDSSDEDENSFSQTRSALVDPTQQLLKKQASLKEDQITVKEVQAFGGDVFETEEGEIDESAVDDDDDPSHWEDMVEDSRDPSIDEKTFQRVDARSNLTPRQSLITILLQDQRRNANALANPAVAIKSASAFQRSVRSTPNGPSLAVTPNSEDNLPLMMRDGLKAISEVPRSQPRPITHTQGLALSPRSTRRNMLASELSISLRENLLWERKQKSQTAITIPKRRRAAHEVAILKQITEKVCMDQSDSDEPNWNDYYGRDLGGDHSRGW